MMTARGTVTIVDDPMLPPAVKLDVQWSGPADDKTGRCGDYVLRFEQMSEGHWWWRVTCGGRVVQDSTEAGGDAATANAAYMRTIVTMADHMAVGALITDPCPSADE